MSTPIASLVIVNWNTKEYLEECLRSFYATIGDLASEVIVVDNASQDGSAAMVVEQFPSVRLIANSVNNGFAGGVNQGIAAASGEYVVILNPDIVFSAGTFPALVQVMQLDQRIGAVMPELVNPDGSRQFGYIRRRPTLMQVLLFSTFLTPLSMRSRMLVERYLENPATGSGVADVDQIPGAFTMVRREVLSAVGGMDESFKLFFEDVDWCQRIRNAGWRLAMVHDVRALHIGGRSFVGPEKEWIYVRFSLSLMHYAEKHLSMPVSTAIKSVLFLNAVIVTIVRSLFLPFSSGEQRVAQRSSLKRNSMFLFSFIRSQFLRQDIPLHGPY